MWMLGVRAAFYRSALSTPRRPDFVLGKLVNGKQKIGFFASECPRPYLILYSKSKPDTVGKSITKGEELLFDYGVGYWSKNVL